MGGCFDHRTGAAGDPRVRSDVRDRGETPQERQETEEAATRLAKEIGPRRIPAAGLGEEIQERRNRAGRDLRTMPAVAGRSHRDTSAPAERHHHDFHRRKGRATPRRHPGDSGCFRSGILTARVPVLGLIIIVQRLSNVLDRRVHAPAELVRVGLAIGRAG